VSRPVEAEYLAGPIVEDAPWGAEPPAGQPVQGHGPFGVARPGWHPPEYSGCYQCPSKTRACR